jgi:2-phospho-L-lactate guanylyltransferase (CobY/MobA/RfbA family)
VTRRAYVLSIGKRKEMHMTILSDIIDALAAAAIVAGVICLAIAMNP